MLRRVVQLAAIVALGCASSPPAPAAGRATLFGTLRLVPHHAARLPPAGAGGYADPRLREARYVDYSHPGFAVVYVQGREAPPGAARVWMRASEFGARLEPQHVALGAGRELILSNATQAPQTLSIPSLGAIRQLAPGESWSQRVGSGAHDIFLLGTDSQASVFAAPGPYAVVAPSGQWELRDLEPGIAQVHAWHPRFPPVSREIELVAGRSARLELEVGVERSRAESHASH